MDANNNMNMDMITQSVQMPGNVSRQSNLDVGLFVQNGCSILVCAIFHYPTMDKCKHWSHLCLPLVLLAQYVLNNLRDACQFFSFSCSFPQKLCQIRVLAYGPHGYFKMGVLLHRHHWRNGLIIIHF